MSKLILTFLLTLGGVASAMTHFPDGKYTGSGSWKATSGDYGQFDSSLVIRDNQLTSEYRWDRKVRERTVLTAHFKTRGFFSVTNRGEEVGEGYCGDTQCHWQLTVGSKVTEETLTFLNGRVYRIGSRLQNGVKEVWQEELSE